MKSFIEETVQHIVNVKKIDIPNTTFVLPSIRAGIFLKEVLKKTVQQTLFAPKVLSIEEFVKDISNLNMLDNTNSIFKFYKTYRQLAPKEEQEDFETFYGWAQTLIYDFNEIDRYLIQPESFFSYLSKIQDINHWSIRKPQTELIKNYLSFWNKLPTYYAEFTNSILKENEAYQGLMYRVASEKIEDYLQNNTNQIIFLGFNALNNAEQKIIQEVLSKEKGEVFWDIDKVFFEDPQHEASLFLRDYQKKWAYYTQQNNIFHQIGKNFQKEKEINFVGIPKNIGQAKHVGDILKSIPQEDLKKTAVILNDEALLSPLLNSFPKALIDVNITMGLPLENTPTASLFETLFKIQEEEASGFYYKNVLAILNHPVIIQKTGNQSLKIQQQIASQNIVFLTKEELIELSDEAYAAIWSVCFNLYENKPLLFIENLIELTQLLKPDEAQNKSLETEYLFHFHKLFKKLQNLLQSNSPIQSIKSLYRIYRDILSVETLDFSGSPFNGLQLMGMLESRVLDFETVILTSVNEGILPAGKNTNSFIPFDLKKEYGLPTYKEKDAIYTYHFYRLLQRAKTVYLLYNTDKTGLGTKEKSRFLMQLEVEKQNLHKHTQQLINPTVFSFSTKLKEIKKTPEIISKLEKLATHGFSPSALTTYIRNPLDFYKNYILGIRDIEEVEETVAANTLGTVVHDTLEHFYMPLLEKELTVSEVEEMLKNTAYQITKEFAKTYKKAPIDKGRNLIVFEIAKRYVTNFLKEELKLLQEKHSIKIVEIETKLKAKLPFNYNFPIYLSGKVDRIDQYNDTYRIIDYKTGKVLEHDLLITEWELLTKEAKYSKAFQVLCYAYMINSQKPINNSEAGIVSFKNLKNGFMKFGDKTQSKKPVYIINQEVLSLFENELKNLIEELLNPEIPFVEKEV